MLLCEAKFGSILSPSQITLIPFDPSIINSTLGVKKIPEGVEKSWDVKKILEGVRMSRRCPSQKPLSSYLDVKIIPEGVKVQNGYKPCPDFSAHCSTAS
jgi:hypothetical protein